MQDTNVGLSYAELRILVAVSAKPLSGYGIVRQVEEDSHGAVSMSNGTLYPALRRLQLLEAIEDTGMDGGGPGRGRRVWRISRTGRLILEWEISSLRRLVRQAEQRI